MSDASRTDACNGESPNYIKAFPPLPRWLARRLLRPGERVTWVYGPRFNPSWERYATHPLLFVAALVFAAACLGLGYLIGEGWSHAPLVCIVAAPVAVFGAVFVLAIACGYFTRLVVTNSRLVILQGYEVCRSWDIGRLPRSLIRYAPRDDDEEERTIDLDALKTMLGTSAGHFAEAKTILAFGKQLDRIRPRENDRPDSRSG